MTVSLDEVTMNEIKTQLDVLAENLLDPLEKDDRTNALVAQQAFTGAIATLWNMAEEVGIDPKLKAVSRLVVGWAIEELPKQIQDPANNLEIKRQLKIFRRSLLLI